ncbi:MAG: STAS domain-containing protein [Planctomycetes bacterium]|nr:STAS domain-containing protein [Planctomycetota bacterium]
MSEFKIETQRLPNNIIALTLKGFLDAYTYGELEQAINNFFDEKVYKFIVDMSNVDYISSAGAGVFIGAIGVSQENQGNIVIVKPKPNVKEVFDLLGISQIFPIANNVEAALKVFEA